MSGQRISKNLSQQSPQPNLLDYDAAQADFSWQELAISLQGPTQQGGSNIAYLAIERHLANAHGEHVALRCLAADRQVRDFSYAQLSEQSNRFANLLQRLGIGKGDCICALTGRIPELFFAAFGALKNRSVFCPLFSAYGPEPIRTRLELSQAKLLVTTTSLYSRRKIQSLREQLSHLQHVVIINDTDAAPAIPDTLDWQEQMRLSGKDFSMQPTEPEDPALLHFTSGTTGTPKGALHVHQAALLHYHSARLALDLQAQDVFWCTADPGWVTGTSYGMIAPLLIGATLVVDSGEFEPGRWYDILQQQQVSVWYTAPTAIRLLMSAGDDLAAAHDFSRLRFIASVGEPLSPTAVLWSERVLGLPFHDTWWQTETGGIMIANYAAMDIKPGSIGRPLPGIEAAIVRRCRDGGIEIIDAPDETGELALRSGWPSMFRTYLNEPQRYAGCFVNGWYLSGDLMRRDADGYFWFVARDDDVIKSAGQLIGPFEVEAVLMQHAAVAEVAVIGKPDPLLKELVKAFVRLNPGFQASDALARQLLGHARQQLGVAVAPREIEFCQQLPKTDSGKILRRELKQRELDLDSAGVSKPRTEYD
ncbi:MAG: acetate--CoA ligase [Chromatiales bacterium]|jgi:acetyl-CoA synthetase